MTIEPNSDLELEQMVVNLYASGNPSRDDSVSEEAIVTVAESPVPIRDEASQIIPDASVSEQNESQVVTQNSISWSDESTPDRDEPEHTPVMQNVELSPEHLMQFNPESLPEDIQESAPDGPDTDPSLLVSDALGEEMPPVPKKRSPARQRQVRKGRPRRKKGEGLFGIPNILVTAVWCALVLIISLTLGRFVWICAAEVLAFGRDDKTVTITINETDTMDDIIKKLARAELIHYPGLFRLYAQFAVDDGDIQPGMWDLNTKYDYHALVRMMSPSSTKEVVKVMIPEGYTCRQIFALLEENRVCTVQDIAAYAANGELGEYWFLENVARGDQYCLEGFLFPDTYEFYKNDSPRNVLTKMLNNFNNRFDETMRGKIQTLNAHLTDLMRRGGKTQDFINANQFTIRDLVNVASMIEKETSSAQEGYTIASVIYNRLFCWPGMPAYLNIDATIVYALDGKNDLTAEDLRVDSPYNTYTNVGLTPGPISNPGLSSLRAALEPSDTNYYFYVLDPAAGSHIFATTQAEHDANRNRVGG